MDTFVTRVYESGDYYSGQTKGTNEHGNGRMTYMAKPDDICDHYYDGEWKNGE